MIFVWIVAGCVIVSVAYLIPGSGTELWPNLDAAGIALALFVVASLIAFARKQDVTPRRRITVLGFGILAIVLTSYTWSSVKERTEWQARQLGQTGSLISRGIYSVTISDSLLTVLEAYHTQQGGRRRSLGAIYGETMSAHPEGDSMSSIEFSWTENDDVTPPSDIFVVEVSDSHVVWVARHPWFKGRDPDFVGIGGIAGPVQIRATLTERGIFYASEN